MDHPLRHERLDAYRLAKETTCAIRAARFPRGDSDLKDQVRRAAQSCCLNLAEGCYRDGKDRLNHFRIAMGSAAEAVAALDLTQIEDGERLQQNLRRVVAMLCKLR